MNIITLPNPILHQKAQEIKEIDPGIKKLVGEMIQFLKNGPSKRLAGVGLAAPQIGQPLRIIIVWSKGSQKLLPMINPEIIWKSKRTRLGIPGVKNPFEGCLSVPQYWGLVRRFSKVKIRYLTLENRIVIRQFPGFTGIIIQHEIDHLDGILFIDRVYEQKGKLYKIEKNKEGKDMLVPVKLQ